MWVVLAPGEKEGGFGKVLQFEERVVKSVCCFRGKRDRLWVEGEEDFNFDGDGRKNVRVK